MLAFPVAHYLVFTVYVNFQTVLYSFKRWNAYTGNIDWVGFSNYRTIVENLFSDPPFRHAFVNTFLWIGLNVLVLVPASLMVAYILSKKVRLHHFYRIVYFFPSILSIVIVTMVFSFMVNPNMGIVNPILGALGLESWQRAWLGNPDTALPTVFFYCVWAGIGMNCAILMGAISRIPQEMYEVGKLDGITKAREITTIVIPLIWPTISTLVIIGTSAAFTVFLQSQLLTNGGPNFVTNTAALQIVNLVREAEYGVASAFGLLLALVGFAVTWTIKRFLDRRQGPEY